MADWDPRPFQNAINAFLEKQDWSQADLARAAGISPGVINRWMQPRESGMLVRPTDSTLRKVAPAMRVPLNDLLRLVGRVEPDPAVEAKPIELATLLADVETGHHAIEDPDLRTRLADAVRALYQVHAPRRPDRRRQQRERDAHPDGDPAWATSLTPA